MYLLGSVLHLRGLMLILHPPLCFFFKLMFSSADLLSFLSLFIGSNDVFYVAPEFQEHGILTEKVS